MKKIIITAGCALFSMFFGSGNLVYPMILGVEGQSNYLGAILGLIISGVIVPFTGVYAVSLYRGSYTAFFRELGPGFPFILSFLVLSLLGPFGVVPRCITVSYGGIQLLYPELNIAIFNGLFCLLIWLATLKKDKITDILGKYLSPFLLGSLTIIIISALIFGPEVKEGRVSENEFFLEGLHQGYQTMDLLAGLFFSGSIINYLYKHEKENIIAPCIIGALLLALAYSAFVYMGAQYSLELKSIAPEQLLVAVAGFTLGNYAQVISCIAIILACLTTAIILASLFAGFIEERFKLNHFCSTLLTGVITYFISLMGFNNIAIFLGQLLQVIYPALISLTLGVIIKQKWKIDIIKPFFWVTVIIAFVMS